METLKDKEQKASMKMTHYYTLFTDFQFGSRNIDIYETLDSKEKKVMEDFLNPLIKHCLEKGDYYKNRRDKLRELQQKEVVIQ